METTEWMRGQYHPHRIGAFQRELEDGRIWFSYWNGSYWGLSANTEDYAYQLRFQKSIHQDLPWRGLTRNPE